MAHSPDWKVYDAHGHYQAACKDVEMAAAIIAAVGGDGWTIRLRHRLLLWTEGKESIRAGESYDTVARITHERLATLSLSLARPQAGVAGGPQ